MAKGELKTRLVFGPLMLLIVGGVYWIDSTTATRGFLTAGILGLIGLGGVYEFVTMLRGSGHAVASTMLLLFTGALCASALWFTGWQQLDRELYPLAIGTLLLLFPISVRSLASDRMKRGLEEQGATLLGFVWIAWPMFLAQGMAVRHLPSVLFVILVCKGGDIGAYFVGSAIGRHKLIPHVSGGKTIEGAVGSLVASCALAVGLSKWLMPATAEVGLTGAVAIGIMLNVSAQVGDLVESLLKRNCGVKDSSRLLPAHGGVLDLIDSLLFAFPAYFAVLVRLT
ncbi:MAG: phosphatidate cytidylyltransferase [Planctomycetota bacterium]